METNLIDDKGRPYGHPEQFDMEVYRKALERGYDEEQLERMKHDDKVKELEQEKRK